MKIGHNVGKTRMIKSNKTGAAIAVVMLAVVILALINVGLLSLGLQNRLASVKNNAEIAARSAADAGLAKAAFEMNEKLKVKPWDGTTLPQETNFSLTNADSEFDFVITGTDPNDGYNIEVTGRSGRSQRKIYTTFKLKGLFNGPILVRETITLGNNVIVDGYNSSDPTDTEADIYIGTLSTEGEGAIILLGSNSVVNGDVFVGFDGNPDAIINSSGTINGSQISLPEPMTLPTITPPTLTDMGTNINANANLTIGPADSGQYTGISIANGKTLSIGGGDVVLYITGNISMKNNSEMTVLNGASLTLYLDGDFDADKATGISNQTGYPKNFKLYGTGPGIQQYTLKNNGEVFGAVYAPNADVTFKNNGDVKGAITANNVDVKNNGTFYYDETLKNVTINDEGITFTVKMWREE